jgi:ribosomal protein S18 acetylase RimI-like enzyme
MKLLSRKTKSTGSTTNAPNKKTKAKLSTDLQQELVGTPMTVANDSSGEYFTLDVDKERARQTLAKAFAGTEKVKGEPFTEWALQHIKVSQEEREQLTSFMLAYDFWDDLRHNSFQLALQQPDGSIASVISVREYDAVKPTTWKKCKKNWFFLTTTLKLLNKLPRLLTDKALKKEQDLFMKKTDKWLKESPNWKVECAPSEHFWYVHLVGSHPDFNGQGKGKAMMNKLCALADEMGQDMLLEAGEGNHTFYAKFGFETQKIEEFPDPEDVSTPFQMHIMTRKLKTVLKQ